MSAYDHVEPTEEPIIRDVQPKAFNPNEIDPEQVVISYDRQSDHLLIHLFGRNIDTISVPVADYLSVLVTPDTETIVGFHVEGFLAQAVKDIPESVELLDYAELRGITPAEVRALQSDALDVKKQLAAPLRASPVRNFGNQKTQAISSFIDAERAHWGLPSAWAAH